MPALARRPLDRDAKLQRHPELLRAIARPDAVFPAGHPEQAVQLSPEALEILDGFARPRKIRDVVADADDEVLAALEDWVARGLLVRTARPVSASQSAPDELRLWERSLPRMRARVAKLRPARRERISGRALAVVDGAFTQPEIDAAAQCARDARYVRIATRGHGRDMHEVPGHVPFIDCITAVVERVFPRRRLELCWAYFNRMRYGDVAFAHADTETESLTAVYYANAQWDDDWGGETLFYDETGEGTVVVAPRPGRLAIFEGRIAHRPGVPSRLCHEGRLAMVVRYWIRDAPP